MAMRSVFRFSPWATALPVLLCGCGPSRPTTVPVSGTVLLDGEPVESAAVIFSSVEGGRPATGITDAQGRFRLRTFDGNDGVLTSCGSAQALNGLLAPCLRPAAPDGRTDAMHPARPGFEHG